MKKDSLALALERAAQVMAGTVTYVGYERELSRALIELWQQGPRTEEVRNAILEEIAGRTTMRSFANGEFNWCITDYDIRALKTPVSPQRESSDA